MKTRRTVARATLLTTAALSAFALAACGGGQPTASGGATTSASGGGATTFAPVTPTSTTTATTLGTPAGGGGGETGGGTTECKAANLTLSLGSADAAAGHIDQALQFTNASKAACVIVGFPGVSYVTGASGAQVGQPAEREGTIGQQVLLHPGQVASTVINEVDVGVFDASACKPTPTRGFRVYPPDSTASVFIAQNGMGCAGNPPSPQLQVQTIKAGPGNA
jgi:hypothetical protein